TRQVSHGQASCPWHPAGASLLGLYLLERQYPLTPLSQEHLRERLAFPGDEELERVALQSVKPLEGLPYPRLAGWVRDDVVDAEVDLLRRLPRFHLGGEPGERDRLALADLRQQGHLVALDDHLAGLLEKRSGLLVVGLELGHLPGPLKGEHRLLDVFALVPPWWGGGKAEHGADGEQGRQHRPLHRLHDTTLLLLAGRHRSPIEAGGC